MSETHLQIMGFILETHKEPLAGIEAIVNCCEGALNKSSSFTPGDVKIRHLTSE